MLDDDMLLKGLDRISAGFLSTKNKLAPTCESAVKLANLKVTNHRVPKKKTIAMMEAKRNELTVADIIRFVKEDSLRNRTVPWAFEPWM